MIGKVLLDEEPNRELAHRIVLRLIGQAQPEIMYVLQSLFPNSPAMRMRSVADDLSGSRDNAEGEFMELLETDEAEIEVFETLSSANVDPELISRSRSSFDPTKFEVTLTCARTPFKELFSECKLITCESCVEKRMTAFVTDNKLSKSPWSIKMDRVESRRLDICKSCGQILKGSQINLQNERLLYKCTYCGHKGWTKAK
ncbi:MAG: hypothetical protein ACW98K_09855 [Candidatus Kariarchaeaceae archaeon]|jgi:DNA-directed RNA polymerase subunit RPC12/RpoP